MRSLIMWTNSLQVSSSSNLGSVQVLFKHARGAGRSEGNAYFAYVVREGGGSRSRGKMLILLM